MGNFIPSTQRQREEMLSAIGVGSIDELYDSVPDSIRLERLEMPDGISEMQALERMTEYAGQNLRFRYILRGAGAYDHYIPAIVGRVTSKEEFVTAYTPYQAEISQGVLQSIFEYQTMICALTGMDVANASVYDGATAAAEAAAMCRDRKRHRIVLSGALHPDIIETVQTYCDGADVPVLVLPHSGGHTDIDALRSVLGDGDAAFCFAQPSFFGCIEDAEEIVRVVHEAGAKVIMSVNPITAALLRTPHECGADIAVGEGQPLGMPLSFGGPYLGFMATGAAMMRKLPGRIVGQTTDDKGRRCFVLTLQAREQHIRREKASSNICSNQALCAMTASVYLAAMGPQGLEQVAQLCYDKAHYLAKGLTGLKGFERVGEGEFFHEFITACPDSGKLLSRLEQEGILGGLPVDGGLLWCVTERCPKAVLDRVIEIAKEVAGA